MSEHSLPAYWTTVGSDVIRDGMFAELWREANPAPVLVAEAFWSDASAEFTVAFFEGPLPISVVERFLSEARATLPPTVAPLESNRVTGFGRPR